MNAGPRSYPEENDDPAFLTCVDQIISTAVASSHPEGVYLIRIDNWFDHKWLTFSGIGIVVFDTMPLRDVALKEHHMDRVTFPPFNPNRLRSQMYFCRTSKGHYEEQAPERLVHRAEQHHSARNLDHRVLDFADSALFIWYSSKTAANGRGSVMVYSVHDGNVLTWFASFVRDRVWKIDRVKGANRADVEAMLESA